MSGDREWLSLFDLPIGDHRFLLREFKGAEGQTAVGYFTGNTGDYRRAPISEDAEPLGFAPLLWRPLLEVHDGRKLHPALVPTGVDAELVENLATRLLNAFVAIVDFARPHHDEDALVLEAAAFQALSAALAGMIVHGHQDEQQHAEILELVIEQLRLDVALHQKDRR